jgi:hypothetical protein
VATGPIFVSTNPSRTVPFSVVVSSKAEELLREASVRGLDDRDEGDVEDEGMEHCKINNTAIWR